MTESETPADGEQQYVYVCPVCGHAENDRLTASKHLVNRHLICAPKEDVVDAGGVQYEHTRTWKKHPEVDALAE